MLHHPTLDQLRHLKLHGMARAFAELGDNAQAGELDHAQWLALPRPRRGRTQRHGLNGIWTQPREPDDEAVFIPAQSTPSPLIFANRLSFRPARRGDFGEIGFAGIGPPRSSKFWGLIAGVGQGR